MVVYSIINILTYLGRYITNIHTSSCLLDGFISVYCVFGKCFVKKRTLYTCVAIFEQEDKQWGQGFRKLLDSTKINQWSWEVYY